MLIVIKVNIMSVIKMNKKMHGMIPDTFIHKYNNLSIKTETENINIYVSLLKYGNKKILTLNPHLMPSDTEMLLFKVNYTRRLQTRYLYIKTILSKIMTCQDIQKIIFEYIGIESAADLFNNFICKTY